MSQCTCGFGFHVGFETGGLAFFDDANLFSVSLGDEFDAALFGFGFEFDALTLGFGVDANAIFLGFGEHFDLPLLDFCLHDDGGHLCGFFAFGAAAFGRFFG